MTFKPPFKLYRKFICLCGEVLPLGDPQGLNFEVDFWLCSFGTQAVPPNHRVFDYIEQLE